MSRIFTLLLNTKVVTTEKIKGIAKIAIETTLKMARNKATVKGLPVKTHRLSGWLVREEYDKKKTIYPFKTREFYQNKKL